MTHIIYYLNSLDSNVTEIIISSQGLTQLPDLSRFTNLTHLYCSYNELTSLPTLNDNLIFLKCDNNPNPICEIIGFNNIAIALLKTN
jgi:Leucine-rich repeat (LRR) protein